MRYPKSLIQSAIVRALWKPERMPFQQELNEVFATPNVFAVKRCAFKAAFSISFIRALNRQNLKKQ